MPAFRAPRLPTAAALRPLPIEALRLPAETVELVAFVGHLADRRNWRRCRARSLRRVSGRGLPSDGTRPRAGLSEPLPAYGPPPRFLADWSPEYAAARREIVEAAMERLIGRLAAMLARCGRGALRLQCRLWFLGQPPLEFAVGLFEATARPENLFPLVQLQLERLRLPGPVRAMSVEATTTAPLECRQQELFPDDSTALAAAAAGRAGRAAQQPAGSAGRGAGAAAARGPAGIGLPLRAAGAGQRCRRAARAGSELGRRSCRRGLCGCWRGRVGLAVTVARARRPAAAVADRRPAAADRPLLGAGADRDRLVARPCRPAAIITGWRRRPAAACGSFAAFATAGGSCTGCSIEGKQGREIREIASELRNHCDFRFRSPRSPSP